MRWLLCVLLCLCAVIPVSAAPTWEEYATHAQPLPTLEPTPTGEGHLGLIDSGKVVQVRFKVPAGKPTFYRANLSNVVAFTGKGTSYQLVVRADRPDGPVVYEGPTILNGDAWNESNREPIDLSAALKPEHSKQGYLDLYVTGLIQGDGWTLYKQGGGRNMVALAVVLTPELQKQIEQSTKLAQRGIAIIPEPQEVVVGEGDVKLTGIVAGKQSNDLLCAAELAERVKELGLPALKPGGNVWLYQAKRDEAALAALRKQGFAAKASGHAEGYTLQITPKGAVVCGDDAAGLFYGVQTLRQLLKGDGGGVRAPALQITDWPAYKLRGWQYDIARGQTINLDFCKRLVRESARHKMNCIMLYMEGDFQFEKYPFVGREGTFDKQKALALDEYATAYHLQLIPQYEALGHASATLKSESLKDLRENGSPWVYCTSEPKTWQFLDDVFGELAAAFPHSKYFHVGADEFEMNFGLCPRCKPKGIGPLYVEHMTKLNDLCKKYGRTMLFWPSHRGPTEELSYLSLKYAKQMPKDCIPTEWIYHGPATYPEIEQYQKAGYEDVIVSPAVVDYSIIWPDYTMTFRGIRGFYQAGAERKCGGAICTTWELMYGGLYENSWYGIIYAAECGWSLGRTSKSDYDRRFAVEWLGNSDPKAADLIASALYSPMPPTGPAALWRNGKTVKDLFWCSPQDFRRRYMQREPLYLQRAPALAEACQQWADNLQALGKQTSRNRSTVEYGDLARRMFAHVAEKLLVFDQAAKDYSAAQEALRAGDGKAAGEKLLAVATSLTTLQRQVVGLQDGFQYAISNMGAFAGDLKELKQQQEEYQTLVARLQELAKGVIAGTLKELPVADELGLSNKIVTRVGSWEPDQMSEQEKELRYDLTPFLKAPGRYVVEFEYTRGAHGLRMQDVRLLMNGEIVARDAHSGWAGGGSRGNVFILKVDKYEPGRKYELVVTAASSGGTDSRGELWMSID